MNNDINPKVLALMKQPQPVQRTPEWFKARESRVTASAVSSLLVRDEKTCGKYIELYGLQDTFDCDNKCCNPYSSKQQFIMSKIKQTFTGSIATYHGQKYEEIASRIYERLTGAKVLEFGLIQHPTENWIAASPDGITTEGIMLEIKCPFRRKITGVPTLYYYQQVQIQLEVCDLEYCDFLECEIIEVASIKEFLDDSLHGNIVQQKGMLIQIEDIPDLLETRSYLYPPKEAFNNPIELDRWVKQTTMAIIEQRDWQVLKETDTYTVCMNDKYQKFTIHTIFWKVPLISCVRIKRDREWWANIKDHLHSQWNDVLYFKNNYNGNEVITLEEEDDCLF